MTPDAQLEHLVMKHSSHADLIMASLLIIYVVLCS